MSPGGDWVPGETLSVVVSGSGLAQASDVRLLGDGQCAPNQPDVVGTGLSVGPNSVTASLRIPLGWHVRCGEHPYALRVTTPSGTGEALVTVSDIGLSNSGNDASLGGFDAPLKTFSAAFALCGTKEYDNGLEAPWGCAVRLEPGIYAQAATLDIPASTIVYGKQEPFGPDDSQASILEPAGGGGTGVQLGADAVLARVRVRSFGTALVFDSGSSRGANGDPFQVVEDCNITANGTAMTLDNTDAVLLRSTPASTPMAPDMGMIVSNSYDGIVCFDSASLVIRGDPSNPFKIINNGFSDSEKSAIAVLFSSSLLARDAFIAGNYGYGVFVGENSAYAGGDPSVDLGTPTSPGNNLLQGSGRANLHVQKVSTGSLVSAVGNCWSPPSGSNYSDAVAGASGCGVIRVPFISGGTTYIDASGKTAATLCNNGSSPATIKYNYNNCSGAIQF